MPKQRKEWSYAAGEKGRNRVRVFERSGVIYADAQDGSGGRIRKSLGHNDRTRAKRQADEMAAQIARSSFALRADDLRLGPLFDKYLGEVTPGKAKSSQGSDQRSARLFEKFLGRECKVATLSRRDWDGFIRARGSGQLRPSQSHRAAGIAAIDNDLKWLMAVLNWAETWRDASGQPLLDRNPLRGLPRPHEKNPQRPLLSEEQYQAMLAVADEVGWRGKVVLVLAWETGHRIRAILKLRWSDISPDFRRIRWRSENDKIRWEHEVPITAQAAEALRFAQRMVPGIGDAWVLPNPRNALGHWNYLQARDWWYKAERLAGIPRVPAMGWHACRRRFATDLKNIPLPDLAKLGGWKSTQTILRCYQMADEETMRTALEQRRRATHR